MRAREMIPGREYRLRSGCRCICHYSQGNPYAIKCYPVGGDDLDDSFGVNPDAEVWEVEERNVMLTQDMKPGRYYKLPTGLVVECVGSNRTGKGKDCKTVGESYGSTSSICVDGQTEVEEVPSPPAERRIDLTPQPKITEPQTPESKGKRAEETVKLMDYAIDVVRPSNISSHIKGDVLELLTRLRNEEALRILGVKV